MGRLVDNCPAVTALSTDVELRLARAVLALRWMVGVSYQALARRVNTSISTRWLLEASLSAPERYPEVDFASDRARIKTEIQAIDTELARRAQQQAEFERDHA